MVPDFVNLIVGREVSGADVCENNIAATTVSLGTPQLVASVRVSAQNDKFAVVARLLDARPRCRQPG